MEDNNTNSNKAGEGNREGHSFTFKEFMRACLAKWQWFALSATIFTCLGVLIAITTTPKYQRSMSVLIKDPESTTSLSEMVGSFSAFGIGGAKANVYNELLSLTSPDIISEVVRRLDLTVNYTLKHFPADKPLYGASQPFKLTFPDLEQDKSVTLKIDVKPTGEMTFYDISLYDKDDVEKFDNEVHVPAGATSVRTPVGTVQIAANPEYKGEPIDEDITIEVGFRSFRSTVEKYCQVIGTDLADRDAEIIDIKIKDTSEERADDILNTLVDVYSQRYIDDKNEMSEASAMFIEDRLANLERELGAFDGEVMKFKSDNLLPDLEEAARLNMASTHEIESQILEASSMLSMAQYVADYVKNPSNVNKVIPVNTGGISQQLEAQINTYNNLLLTRNNVAENSSANNPIVKDYDSQLKGMRESIERGVSTNVVTHTNTLRNLERAKGELRGQLKSAPNQAKQILTTERQQKVKEALYIYLLQKREENRLNRKYRADNMRVIAKPNGPLKPVSPRKKVTAVLSFLFGLLVPGIAIYMRESGNTKVRSRNDLEHMATPFMGEIPVAGKKKLKFSTKLKRGGSGDGQLESIEYKVSSGNRDLLNESFRIVRGNIDFLNRKNNDKVVMLTSFEPRSGKSFIAYNLAASFAVNGKKVLIVDCDLRHGSVSQYVGMPDRGITSWLNGETQDWHSLVTAVSDQPGMYVMPIGHRPPNPSELLDTPAMKKMLDEARGDYDIIFLDCPPTDIVVDTQILGPLCDSTLFVICAGQFEKEEIAEIDKLYESGKFNKMAVVLNGTENRRGRYAANDYYSS